MATTRDSDDRDPQTPALFAFLCGALVGAAVATLFAPSSGRDTRGRLYSRAREFADSREISLARFEAQLEEWSAAIDRLAARASELTAETRADLDRLLGDLRVRLEHARRTLAELRVTGEDAWRELAAAADRAWHELRRGVESASSKFTV